MDGQVPLAMSAILVHLFAQLAPEDGGARVEPAARLHTVEEASRHEEGAARTDQRVIGRRSGQPTGERRRLCVEALEECMARRWIGAQLGREQHVEVDQVRDAPGESGHLPAGTSAGRGGRDPFAHEVGGDVVPLATCFRPGSERGRNAEGQEVIQAVQLGAPGKRESGGIPVDASGKPDRAAEVGEAPATHRSGTLEHRARLADVLPPELGQARKKRLAIANPRVGFLAPARAGEQRS